MDKFLFTDSIGEVKEVFSLQELQNLAERQMPGTKMKVWVFDRQEWISYEQFTAAYPRATVTTVISKPSRKIDTGKKWLKKFLFFAALAGGALLVVNFTSPKWQKAVSLETSAIRPLNVPSFDFDSLVSSIELDRGKTLDKSTRNNLRLRNTWPDQILLQLHADKETSTNATRFSNLKITIDNSTGYLVDHAIVNLECWKQGKIDHSDTLVFDGINYDKLNTRILDKTIKTDSLSVSFGLIRAKAFNFLYDASEKNNSANYYDKWFSVK
jgi:hypothetical protein